MIDSRQTWRALRALAREGKLEDCVQLLQAFFDAGGWFAPDRLLDQTDLLGLRGDERFASLIDVARTRRDEAIAQTPPSLTLVYPDTSPPWPVLLALHGNEQSVLDALPHWSIAAERGWLVALPQSGSIIAPNTFAWAAATTGEIVRHVATLRSLHATGTLVLAGSGRGAYHALRLALSGFVQVAAVIAVSPSMNDLDEIQDAFPSAAARGLSIAFVYGSRDETAVKSVAKVSAQLRQAGVRVTINEHPDQGHGFPKDFPKTLRDLLLGLD